MTGSRSAAGTCLACGRPALGAARSCPYCGEDVRLRRGAAAARRLLPLAAGLLLALALACLPPHALADAWRRLLLTPRGALALALALLAAGLPPPAPAASGAPPPDARRRRLLRLGGSLSLGLAALLAALAACAQPRPALLPAPLLAYAALLPLPLLHRLPPWPLLAAPLLVTALLPA